MSQQSPELSVVLATSSLDIAQQALDHYRRQTAATRIELLLVAPRAEFERVEADAAGTLAALRAIETDGPFTLPTARAQGVMAASAPWVFVGETHSFAEPEMAECLLAAIAALPEAARPAGLVPCIYNVNPSGAVSCASFLIDYGGWGPGHAAGEPLVPPIYNGLFARADLRRLEGALARALSPHDDSLAPVPTGPDFLVPFVPQARIGHLNVVRFGDFVFNKAFTGMAVADVRARRWGLGRRLAYAAAWPLIGLVLLRRYLASYRVARRVERLPAGVLPLFVVGAFARAAAEALAYLGWRTADLYARIEHFEIFKADYVPGWNR